MKMRNWITLALAALLAAPSSYAVNGKFIVSQPITTSGTYFSGMVVGGSSTITVLPPGGNYQGVTLDNVTIIDTAAQSTAMDLFFFQGPTPPALNFNNNNLGVQDKKALQVEPTSLGQSCVGVVSVIASDYVSAGNFGVATKQITNLNVQPDNSNGAFYVVPVTRGQPTYTGPAAITLKFGLYYSSPQ